MFNLNNIPQNLIPSDPRFGAGPSKVPVSFIEKLHETGAHLLGTSHRKDAVKNLGKEITLGLKNTSLCQMTIQSATEMAVQHYCLI